MFTHFILVFFSFVFLIKTANAGTLTDLLLTDTVKSLDPAQRAAQGGIGVSLLVILFKYSLLVRYGLSMRPC